MTTHTGTENQPYVVVTNSGGVSEIAEVGGWVATLHIDYDDCNSTVEEAKRYADDVLYSSALSRERKEYYLREIFQMYEDALGEYLDKLLDEEGGD